VRWNAALALAHRSDAAAVPVLRDMLDRSHLATVAGLTAEQREEAMLAAVAAAARLGGAELRKALAELRSSDPSLRIRQAAGIALESRAAAP